MNDTFSEAVEMLEDTLREELSEPVVYEGDGDRVELLAVASKPEEMVDVSTGEVHLSHDDLDWMFCSRDLTLSGKIAQPKPGHRIVRLRNRPGDSQIYEVLPDGNRQCYRRMDAAGRLIQVHTKRIQ
jgi:hypothetical protein